MKKTKKSLMIVSMVTSLLVVLSIGTFAWQVDFYIESESNNVLADADSIPFGHGKVAVGVVTSSDQYDWYKIQPTSTDFDASLDVPKSADIDMVLFDENGKVISTEGATSGFGNDEKIKDVRVDTSKTYYIRVQHFRGTMDQPYMLDTY